DVIAHARQKLEAKRCDLVVANDVTEPGAGFAVDTNHVTLVDRDAAVDVPSGPKAEVAHRILDRVVALLAAPPAAAAADPAPAGRRAAGAREAVGARRAAAGARKLAPGKRIRKRARRA